MNGNVLVLGDAQGLLEALELLLLGRARVRHAPAAGETEGIGVDVVVVTGPGASEHVRDIQVHPRLRSVPTVALSPEMSGLGAQFGVWVIDTRRLDVLEDLTERVSWLLARAHHPSRMGALGHADSAA
jgi:hypothetical protein